MEISKILIRADSSRLIGSGHVRRMSVLSEELRLQNFKTALLTNSETKFTFPKFKDHFDDVLFGETEEEIHSAIKDRSAYRSVDAVFFDHYKLSSREHQKYRSYSKLLIGIDDLANRLLDWDMIFDSNYNRTHADYKNFIKNSATCFFGASFQIVHPVFSKFASIPKKKPHAKNVERIFVSLGGTDPRGYLVPLIKFLTREYDGIKLDVVVGSAAENFLEIQQLSTTLTERVNLFPDASNVAELMHSADFAIGAGGTMTWERNILSLPTLILIIADNQLQVGEFMRDSNSAMVLDARKSLPEVEIKHSLDYVFGNPAVLQYIAANASNLSNTDGASNIAQCIAQRVSSADKW